jgi:DNA-directed RNA polymerase specialized sigma24 family protein
MSPEAQPLTPDVLDLMQESLQRLARCEQQAYTLLQMHVIKGVATRELAALQGVSRSTVHRSLVQAKASLRAVYESAEGA